MSIKYFEYDPDEGSIDVYISDLEDEFKSQINKMLIKNYEDELSYESDVVNFDEYKVNKYYYVSVSINFDLDQLKKLLIDNGYKMTKNSWLK